MKKLILVILTALALTISVSAVATSNYGTLYKLGEYTNFYETNWDPLVAVWGTSWEHPEIYVNAQTKNGIPLELGLYLSRQKDYINNDNLMVTSYSYSGMYNQWNLPDPDTEVSGILILTHNKKTGRINVHTVNSEVQLVFSTDRNYVGLGP